MKKLKNISKYIPEEVVEQILSKVPVKSLLRFLSVSKIWNRLISRLNSYGNGNNRTIFLFGHYSSRNNSYIFWVDKDGTFQSYAMHKSPVEKGFPVELHFNCCGNGLICFSDLGQHALLWNPSIRRSLILPNSDVELAGDHRYAFGIVVDQITNEYKIIRTDSNGDSTILEICRVSAGSVGSWERLNCKAPFVEIYGYQVDLKGISYWIATGFEDDPVLVTFDGHAELFGSVKIPVPGVVDNELFWYECEKYLFLYEESLVFIHSVHGEEESDEDHDVDNGQFGSTYKIWKMEGSEGSTWNLWSKISFNDSVTPLGFRENGELLWSGEFRYVSITLGLGFTRRFISMNREDGSDIRLPSYVINHSCSYPNFVESLALLSQPPQI